MQKIKQTILNAYLDAFYFIGTGEEGQPSMDADFAPETLKTLEADIEQFLNTAPLARMEHSSAQGWTWDQVGHDLYFSRQGHGTGFWDSQSYGSDTLADQLDQLAKQLGEVAYYQGDDGNIYQ